MPAREPAPSWLRWTAGLLAIAGLWLVLGMALTVQAYNAGWRSGDKGYQAACLALSAKMDSVGFVWLRERPLTPLGFPLDTTKRPR